MPTKHAVYDIAEFKAVGDASSGEFSALVSVFGNVDLQGDRVMPGAFKNTLAKWKQSGDPIPVIWSHTWDNPDAHIGVVTSAQETANGLLVTGKNDLSNPFAAQVHKLLVERRVKGMSFAYDVINERTAKDGANELTELALIEVGPTLKGANPDAHLVAAKAALDEAAQVAEELHLLDEAKSEDADGEKAGRRISKTTEAEMQSIHDALGSHAADMQGRLKALMGSATYEEPKSAPEPDVENETEVDREPEAKSIDSQVLAFKTLIESMRA